MYDIFVISRHKVRDNFLQSVRERYPSSQKIDFVDNFDQIRSKSFTKMFWVIWDDIILDPKFDLNSYRVTKWDEMYVHVFLNDKTYDGLALFPKSAKITSKELKYRFYVNKKEVDIVASIPCPYDQFIIENYDQYNEALEKSSTEMFWSLSHNLKVNEDFDFTFYFSHHNAYDRNQNHSFIHKVNDKELYNGIFLFSKNKILSKKEIDHRFPIERKEWQLVASGPVNYEKFIINNYQDYLNAYNISKTEMFWMIPSEIQPKKGFNFDIYFSHDNKYDRSVHHGFKHKFRDEENFNGITLVSKQHKLSKKEVDFRFVIEKKEWDIVASFLKPYDIIFISYKEPNAEENFLLLQKKFPRAKRIHGIKGIHQAHIKAAEMADTEMFFVVDGDAVIENNFNFDYQVPVYERDTVHVWRSRNPINDLQYGYGGVKLLPRTLTLNLDTTSSDMTTSISKKFKTLDEVSNISAFNVDAFSTWRSAFRECAKLASRTIDRQKEAETKERLKIWTTSGQDRPFGNYAISGAKAGMEFGLSENDIKLINDFDWIEQKFKESTK